MQVLTIDSIFDAAIRIQVLEERRLDLHITPGSLDLKFPTTRKLAEFLGIPHYYILPYFAMMEENALVTRAERVGIMTTRKGTRKYFEMCDSRYREEAKGVLGEEMYGSVLARLEQDGRKNPSSPE
jgi:DNA-binding transcriptional regulator YhcF (GntR family)